MVTDGGSGGPADYDEKNTGGGMMYSRLSLLGFSRYSESIEQAGNF